MKRWYDNNEELAKQFENFKNLHPKDKYTIIQGMLDFIRNYNPDILNKFAEVIANMPQMGPPPMPEKPAGSAK